MHVIEPVDMKSSGQSSGQFCAGVWCKGLWELTVGVVLDGSSGKELKSAKSFASCKKREFKLT